MTRAGIAQFTRAGLKAGALGAMPLGPSVAMYAVAFGISAKGGIAERLGLATALIMMRLTGNDLVGAVAAVAIVAAKRAFAL